ncbi:MAG: zinc transport system substrate-binding protein [Phycisphaerales bacterium]|jgi:zinc transport system substrate-binding protein
MQSIWNRIGNDLGQRSGSGERMGVWLWRAAAAAVVAVAGCSRQPEAPSDAEAPGAVDPVRVVVSIPPLAGLVGGLLGEGASVTVLVPPGRSAHGIELTPSDVNAIGRADLVVLVGAGLDASIERVARRSPNATIVEFAQVVGLETDEGHDHAHAEGDGHDHAGSDPHLWLDPVLCVELVAQIGRALGTPTAVIEARQAELRALDEELRATLAPVAGRSIVTHHDSFSRFAARYGFTVAAVVRPLDSVEPTPGELARAAAVVRSSGAVAILIEPQMPAGSAQRLAELTGARVGTLDPLGSGDYFAMMRANAAELVRVLTEADADVTDPVGP